MFNESIDLIKGSSAYVCTYMYLYICTHKLKAAFWLWPVCYWLIKKHSFCALSLNMVWRRRWHCITSWVLCILGVKTTLMELTVLRCSLGSWQPSQCRVWCIWQVQWPEWWASSSLGRGWVHSSSQAFWEGQDWAGLAQMGTLSPTISAWRKWYKRSNIGKPVVSGASAAPSKLKPWLSSLSLFCFL